MDLKEILELIKQNKPIMDAHREIINLSEGNIIPYVADLVAQEFSSPNSRREIMNRIVGLPVAQKVVNKLSETYTEAPVRHSENDQEIVDLISESTDLNCVMEQANKYLEACGSAMLELFTDGEGLRLRAIAPTDFIVHSEDLYDPDSKPTMIIKRMADEWWYVVTPDFRYHIIEGKIAGEIEVNELGLTNFIYMKKGSGLVPPVNEKLKQLTVVPSTILSCLNAGLIYSSHSLMTVVGLQPTSGEDGQKAKLEYSPRSILSFEPTNPESTGNLQVIEPKIKLTETMAYLGDMLTAYLALNDVRTNIIEGDNSASGIAKAIDNSDSSTQTLKSQTFFQKIEKELWDKIATYNNYLVDNTPFVGSKFTPDFEISIQFKVPQPMVSRKEQIEETRSLLDAGLLTKRRALKALFPYETDEMLDERLTELNEQTQNMANIFSNSNDEDDDA